MKQPPKKESIGVFYYYANATGNLCNKAFHVVYSVFKTDLTRKEKKIIGILYNEKDPVKTNLLYFQMITSLNNSFNLDLLLNNVIYKLYNKNMIRKHLTDNPETKKIMDQCLNILKQHSNLP